MKCDRVTGHCNVSVAEQVSCVKKVHVEEINKHSNTEIYLHFKRKIYAFNLFKKLFDSKIYTFLMSNQKILPKIANLFEKKNTWCSKC